MIRIENKCVVGFFNFLGNTRTTERKIIWVELGKKIEFGINKPLPFGCGNRMGLKFYTEFGYIDFLKKITMLWFVILRNKIKRDES